jgi:hypothetical protein
MRVLLVLGLLLAVGLFGLGIDAFDGAVSAWINAWPKKYDGIW